VRYLQRLPKPSGINDLCASPEVLDNWFGRRTDPDVVIMKWVGQPIPLHSVEPAEGHSGKWQRRGPKSRHRRLAERVKRERVCLITLAVTLLAKGLGERWADHGD
jgi:hypothetical protein